MNIKINKKLIILIEKLILKNEYFWTFLMSTETHPPKMPEPNLLFFAEIVFFLCRIFEGLCQSGSGKLKGWENCQSLW